MFGAIHLVRTYLRSDFSTSLPLDKNIKRDSVSAYVHMRRDTPFPLYPPVHILEPSIPLVKYIINSTYILNQKTNKKIQILYSLKYKLSKKIPYQKINGSVEWNKHSGEQC